MATLPPQGHNEIWVDENIEKDYICVICHSIMKDVVQTSCGHKYCRECLLVYMKRVSKKCPVCTESLDIDKEIFPDKFTSNQINAFLVYCRKSQDDGCTWKGRLDKLDIHFEDECDFKWIDCPNDCGQFMYRHQFLQHEKDVCPNRKATCPYCSTDFRHFQLKKHFITCSMFPINCDFCHTPEQIPRMKRENHYKRECRVYPLDCPFAIVGCKFRDAREKMEEHVQKEFLNHMFDFGEHFGKNQNTYPQNCISTSGVSSEIQDMIFRNMTVKKQEIENSIRGLMCNGTYVWKIENFQSKIEKARDKKVEKIYSPPFYSSPFGYKFCLCLLPCGTSENVEESLSIFLHIMKGEYDDTLQWPFSGTVSFRLFNQIENGIDLEETCSLSPNLLFSQRAKNERNFKGYGYDSFLSLEELEANPGFTKNDTLMIRCIVKPHVA